MTDTRAMLECGVDPDNEMLWPGSLSGGIDYPEMAVCLAPRPLLILANEHDFFPIEGAHRTLNALEALWRAGGCETPPEMVTAVSGHAYGPTLAQAAVRFFSKHLHDDTKHFPKSIHP